MFITLEEGGSRPPTAAEITQIKAALELGTPRAHVEIANLATLYASPGVVAGIRYGLADTGDVMEYRGDLSRLTNLSISGAGSPEGPGQTPLDGAYAWDADLSAFVFSSNSSYTIEHDGTRWQILLAASSVFDGPLSDADTHPADTAGVWVAGVGLGSGSIGSSGVTRSDPQANLYNYKRNDVILVPTNDDKLATDALPVGQKVEVTREGYRLEQYNGDNTGLLTSLEITTDAAASAGESYAGRYWWDAAAGMFVADAPGVIACRHNGTAWQLQRSGVANFIAPVSAATVHPADVVGVWTPQVAGETGTVGDGAVGRTFIGTDTNWFAIKNTVRLSIADGGLIGSVVINGVTVPTSTLTDVGWVPVGQRIHTDGSTVDNFTWNVTSIDGELTDASHFPTPLTAVPYTFVIPDAYPKGATIEVSAYA